MARLLKNPITVLAGFVVPLALISSSRSARAGQAAAAGSLTVEREGGVAAPPLLASAAGGPVRAGIGTTAAGRPPRTEAHGLRGAELAVGDPPSGVGDPASAVGDPASAVGDPASAVGGLQLAMPGGGDPFSVPTAPGGLPARLALAIVAASRIATLPYIWGGGHGSFDAAGYDCSGSVSYVLHAALALAAPEDSSGLESYGEPGPGRWITVYANASHAFMTLGGLRYDTIGLSSTGSRWQALEGAPAGYVVRHPVGL